MIYSVQSGKAKPIKPMVFRTEKEMQNFIEKNKYFYNPKIKFF